MELPTRCSMSALEGYGTDLDTSCSEAIGREDLVIIHPGVCGHPEMAVLVDAAGGRGRTSGAGSAGPASGHTSGRCEPSWPLPKTKAATRRWFTVAGSGKRGCWSDEAIKLIPPNHEVERADSGIRDGLRIDHIPENSKPCIGA